MDVVVVVVGGDDADDSHNKGTEAVGVEKEAAAVVDYVVVVFALRRDCSKLSRSFGYRHFL